MRADALAFDSGQMQSIGELFDATLKERLSRGLDRFDQPMPALTKSYKRRKQRRGRKPIRDLRFSGALLSSTGVKEVREGRMLHGIRGRTPNRKGAINQAAAPWYGLSPSQGRVLDERIEDMHRDNAPEAIE